MDRAVTSRTIAQPIQSVMHHSVSVRTIQSRLKQIRISAWRQLLCLYLTGSHMCLHRHWCDERLTWTTEWKGIVFPKKSGFCLHHYNGRI
ncbi:transposable element Tc1 transposase [Trichonephila clavipes]|nr:transposable element Tc1 transposase [Trichonephila clavipes]